MARRSGAVHVATTRRHYKGKTYESHLLRRSYREDGKVKHETLGNISHLDGELVDIIRDYLGGKRFTAVDVAFEIVRSLPHGNVAAVLGTLRKLKLSRLLGGDRSPHRPLLETMIVERVLDPRSKLATTRALNADTASSTLGSLLGVDHCNEDQLYGALDWLVANQGRIEKGLAARHLEDGSMVLYDVSSSCYTGTHCELAKRGHSRDRKTGFPQINYGLMCSRDGCPVAIEVFEGNTGDPKTVAVQLEKLRNRFQLSRVVIVGDRGTLTTARIREELQGVPGIDWVTALRAPAIRKLVEQEILQPSLFDSRDLAEISSPDYPDERLVACFNPCLAAERKHHRASLLEATRKDLAKIQDATKRTTRPLRRRDKIGLRAGRILNRHKVGKHFQLTITDSSLSFRMREERIANEAALDGIYIIRTSVPKSELTAEAVVTTSDLLISVAEPQAGRTPRRS